MSVTESFRITELMIDVGPLSRVLGRGSADPLSPRGAECEQGSDCNNSECDFNCTDPGSACEGPTGGDCPADSCLAQTDCDCSVEDTRGCGECDSNPDTDAGPQLPAGCLGDSAGWDVTLPADPPELVAMRKLLAQRLATQGS